jgi:predicted metal-dependent phosphoesterase TrpH
MIKVDLHTHTDDDPADRIPHTAHQLIDRASALGFGAIAITLHNRWRDPAPLAEYAAERSVTLIPSIERNIGRKHVLLINVPRDAERVKTFADIAALKSGTNALVVAPHPFYPIPSALGHLLDEHAALIDAVEVNSVHVRGLDFNRRALAWARAHGKPVVGNTDLHLLMQMGHTYSMVDAEQRTPDAICAAIRAGRVQMVTSPMSWFKAAVLITAMTINGHR